MPVQASVNISFEAQDRAEAEAKLNAWKLHEGCNVFVSVQEVLSPQQTDAQGKIQPVPEPPPPPPLPEPEPEA